MKYERAISVLQGFSVSMSQRVRELTLLTLPEVTLRNSDRFYFHCFCFTEGSVSTSEDHSLLKEGNNRTESLVR